MTNIFGLLSLPFAFLVQKSHSDCSRRGGTFSTVKSSSVQGRAATVRVIPTEASKRPRTTCKLCTTKQEGTIYYCSHTREPRREGGAAMLGRGDARVQLPSSVLLSQKLKLKKKKRRTACKQHWWGLTVWDLLVKARGVCAVIPTSHHGCSPR